MFRSSFPNSDIVRGTLRLRENTSLTSFTQTFQFNEDCEVPGLFRPCTPSQVWFSPKGFKGILVIDNVTYGVSNTENNPFKWAWDPENVMFELTVDLCGYYSE